MPRLARSVRTRAPIAARSTVLSLRDGLESDCASMLVSERAPTRLTSFGDLPRKRGRYGTELRLDLHVFEIARLVVDADFRRRDPRGELAHLGLRLHQTGDEVAVVGRGQPGALALLPRGIADQLSVRIGMDALELADLAVERDIRQRELEVVAGERDDLVPAQQAFRAVLRIVVAQPHVERGQRRLVDALDLAV